MATTVGIQGQFTLLADDPDTMVANRFVRIDSSGEAVFPDASDDDESLDVIGVTTDNPSAAGYVPVAGFGDGTRKVTVAASQTVAIGNKLYLTGTAGCVITGEEGAYVGIALEAATSGASELAIIEAVLNKPMLLTAGT